MHVLIIPSWFSTDGIQGIFIREHARMTVAMGHQTGFLFVEQRSFLSRPSLRWWKDDNIVYGVMRTWYPPKIALLSVVWIRMYLRLYKLYMERYGIPDVVHAHGFIAGIAARNLSREYKVPYIITEHSSAIPLKKVPWYHLSGLRSAYRDAGMLIAVSAFLARAMGQYVQRSDIRVIFNPVDCARFVPGNKEDKGLIQMICVGALERNKNVRAIVRAVGQVRQQFNVRLQVVGAGAQLSKLRKMAEQMKIAGDIQWTGELQPAEVARCLASSDLLISASRIETFGMAIAEALACGVPVIATDSGGPGEYLNEDCGSIVPADNTAALKEALQDTLRRLSQFDATAIRKRACDLFGFPAVGKQVNRVYTEILATTAQS